MKKLFFIIFFLPLFVKAQVYQAMPQAGYGPVKRMIFDRDGVVTIPIGINSLRNIAGGRDTAQIRYVLTDSSIYVYTGYQWLRIGNSSLDTAAMLAAYRTAIQKNIDSLGSHNIRIGLLNTALALKKDKSDTTSPTGYVRNYQLTGIGSGIDSIRNNFNNTKIVLWAGGIAKDSLAKGIIKYQISNFKVTNISPGLDSVSYIGTGGGSSKYTTNQYGILVDSATANLYKIKVDSTVLLSKLNANATYYSSRTVAPDSSYVTFNRPDGTKDTLRFTGATAGAGEPLITAPNTTLKYWNGYKQFVALNTDSITQGLTNKWYTDALARAAISLTTTGTSGAAVYNNSTGVLNVPQYAGTTYSAGTGLTLTTTTFSVNTSQNISILSNLTSNGLIKTSGGTGALSIATAGTDYQAPISLTTTGSGAATFVSNVLNIPTPSSGGGFTRQVITTGTTATVTAGNYIVTIDPAATIAAFTLTMPASPSDMDVVQVDFGGTLTSGGIVTALTILANTGQTILDNTPPGSATADNTLLYRYRTSNTKWYRFKP